MKLRNKRIVLMLVICVFAVILSVTGLVFARYMAEKSEEDDTSSGKFYISSDLLEKTTADHDATEWTNGITFTVYNYEKSNPSLVSGKGILYEIKLSDGWKVSEIKNDDGNAVESVDGRYALEGGPEKHYHTVTVICTSPASVDNARPLNVTISTVSPYETELSSTFNLIGGVLPEYKVEDKGTYVLLTVYSNLYEGVVNVEWAAAFSPNNGDALMSDWLDVNKKGSLTLEKNHTYELIFFKNTADTYSKPLQSGTTIQVG